ncbi:hypothetical protein ACFV8H_38780, partial [Kitasatospora sp. NPDC059827]
MTDRVTDLDREGTPAPAHRWAGGLRRILLGAGMLVFPALTAVAMSGNVSGTAALAGYAVVVAFCLCYVLLALTLGRTTGRTGPQRTRWIKALLAVMTALFLAALPSAHADAFFLATVLVSV